MYARLSAASPDTRHSNIYIHTILGALKKHNRPLEFSEIKEETGIDVEEVKGLLDILEKNKKIERKGRTLKFVPTYKISTEEDLLQIMKDTNAEHGIRLEDVLDTNVDMQPIVDALIKKGHVIQLKDIDGSSSLFYNPFQIPKASPEILRLYEEVAVPDERELLKELAVAGLSSATSERPVRKVVQTQRKKRYTRKIKLTNTHLANGDLGM